MLEMVKERRYLTDDLWDRLRIFYGQVDVVRRKIDESLAMDDQLRRQCGMREFRSPYRFPDLTEMENSTPPTWIQWISREANELCNELTLIIDQEMNKTLSEFQPILEDVEPEGENQPDLMGFETPRPGNKVGVWGEEGNSPQQGLHEQQNEPQSENSNTTQINVQQTTETAANNTKRIEESSEDHRPQQNEVVSENTQQQNGQVPQNHTDANTRSAIENNTEDMTNTNLNNNHHDTASNNTSVPQVPEERSKNLQNYFQVDTQLNINTPRHTAPQQNQSKFSENQQNFFRENTQLNLNTPQLAVPSQNQSEFSKNSQNYFRRNAQLNVNTPQHAVPSQDRSKLSENSQHSLTQVHSMEPKTQRPQKNGGARRNIMRTRNNT